MRPSLHGAIQQHGLGVLPFLPTVGTAPSLVTGTKKLVSAYAGQCANVVRASDSTATDIGFNATGDVDMAAVATFVSGSEPTIAKWYDQSGNVRDLTNATVATQPRLRTGDTMRGVQGITFDYDTGFNGTKLLNVPVAVTLDARNCTIFVVDAPHTSFSDNVHLTIGDVATGAVALQGVSNGPMRIYLKGALVGTRVARSNISVNALRGGAAASALYVDSLTSTLAVGTAGTTSVAGAIGVSNGFGTQNNYRGEYFAIVIYPAALSDADVASVQLALQTIYGISYSQNRQVVCEGDSITGGLKATFDLGTIRQLYETLAADCHFYNMGLPSTTAQTRYGTRVAMWGTLSRSDSAKKIAHIWLGTNDIKNGGTAATTWTSYLLPYIQYVQSLGYTTLVGTMLPRNDSWTGALETERVSLNSSITGNAVAQGYTAVDYTTLTHFQTQTDASNTTYFADNIHPTNVGGGILAAYLKTFIDAI